MYSSERSVSIPSNVDRRLCHFIHPAASCSCSPIPTVLPSFTAPPCHVIQALPDTLSAEGSLPCHHPQAFVVCASVFHPGTLVGRHLQPEEALCLYDVPSSMDAMPIPAYCWSRPWPFEGAMPSSIGSSVLRQLWSISKGVVDFYFDLAGKFFN